MDGATAMKLAYRLPDIVRIDPTSGAVYSSTLRWMEQRKQQAQEETVATGRELAEVLAIADGEYAEV